MKKTKEKTTKQINKSYHSHMKSLIKGAHEKDIYDSLSAGKNSYLRLDRLASSSFDKSWIEVIEDVIFDLGQIIANPKLNTKVEGSLTPVELARKVNNETVQHLASHTQYIKEIDEYGNVIPSKLLSMYADDDIHTYENRFICTFVRRLMLFITKRYEYVTKYAELRNEEYLYFKNTSIVDGAEVEIETKVKVSYKSDDEQSQINSTYVDRIKQTREYIMYYYNSPFMKAMKNEKDVRNPILQTNIIRKNVKYHHCYEVYRFIETYDRLGVNYKIDENYSMFNDEELNELNRTLFANYITLKGKEMSREVKTNTKTYKPRILTSDEDEAFIYGPLLEGPIEFARVDEGYQKYLESKLRKDLPLHPTKKEKEYYEDEYAKKAELKQDQKQLNDLMKRRQKEVNAFEKSVKNILIEREKARLRLIELEKETIRKEENDLLEAARREIIDAARAKEQAAQEETPKVEQPVQQNNEYVRQESPLSNHPLTFDEAALQVWPQLCKKAKVVIKEQPKVETVSEDKKAEEKPANKLEQQPEYVRKESPLSSHPVTFDEAALQVWPQLNKKAKVTKANKAEEKPVVAPKQERPKENIENKPEPKEEKEVQVVLVPTVSFEDAANEIWPQLDRPVVIKSEPKKASKPVEAKQENIPEDKQPVVATVASNEEESKKAHTVLVPTVSFEDAANEIWPQLNNPKPLVKQEQPVAPVKKEQPKAKEPKRLIKVQFVREDGTVAIIYKKAPKQEQPANENKEEVEPAPVNQPKPVQEQPKRQVNSKPVTFEDVMLEVWPQLKNQKPVNNDVKNEQRHSYKKEKPQKAVKSKNSRKGFRK